MSWRRSAALLLIALPLAGCADPETIAAPAADDATQPTAPTTPEEVPHSPTAAPTPATVEEERRTPWIEVFEVNGTLTGALWVDYVPEDAPIEIEVPVLPNATSLRVQVAWEGNGDFDAVAYAPRYCEEAGVACAMSHPLTRQTGDGYFQDAEFAASPSVVELDEAVLAEWNDCDEPPCIWYGFAYYNAAVNTPYSLRVEVTYRPGP